MRSRTFSLLLLLLIFSLTFAGCSEKSEKVEVNSKVASQKDINSSALNNRTPSQSNSNITFPITVTDDFGFKVVIEKQPERIVSLAPSNTENLFALGLGDRVVGVTDYCNYPPEAAKKPKIGGFTTINIEKILKLNPDLVVASYGNGEQNVETMKNLGLRVIAFNPKSIRDIERDILILGEITGKQDKAEEIVDFMEKKANESRNEFKRKPRVMHILWHDPIWVSGSNTFIDELIKIAGGENVFSDLKGWKIVSKEDIISRNPDVILVSSGSGMGGKGKNYIYEWVMQLDIDAVKKGHVYIVDADLISRPSYRVVYALENISKILKEVVGSEKLVIGQSK
ncbi:MAG: cobalamin-binding protein [Archaeoglobus sp.]|nr:cobalamin-binding protein [Archaeoglobus sp.]